MRNFNNLPVFHGDLEKHENDHAEILVVFVGQTECRYLRWLKKGFRHCFAALRTGDRWIVCDSLKNQLEFSLIDLPYDFDLGKFYRGRGHTVVTGAGSERVMTASTIPELMTCVTIVKRVIGIRSFWTLTPWQLFRLLISMNNRWRLVD